MHPSTQATFHCLVNMSTKMATRSLESDPSYACIPTKQPAFRSLTTVPPKSLHLSSPEWHGPQGSFAAATNLVVYLCHQRDIPSCRYSLRAVSTSNFPPKSALPIDRQLHTICSPRQYRRVGRTGDQDIAHPGSHPKHSALKAVAAPNGNKGK